MRLLVSFCNRRRERFGPMHNIFLAAVDTEKGSVRPVALPEELTTNKRGATGITCHGAGYVCAMLPSSLAFLSPEFHVTRVYDLPLLLAPHSVACHQGRVYIASTGSDSIVEFTPETGAKTLCKLGEGEGDTIHLNSLTWHEGRCIVSAFGKKPGTEWRSCDQGYVADLQSGTKFFTELAHPHSVTFMRETLWVCESSRQLIHSTDGHRIPVPYGYIRGLALSEGHLCVGSSKGRNLCRPGRLAIDNPADPGELSGVPGVAVYGLATDVQMETFVDLSPWTDEVYDVVALDGTP